jgi:hypothetical protein
MSPEATSVVGLQLLVYETLCCRLLHLDVIVETVTSGERHGDNAPPLPPPPSAWVSSSDSSAYLRTCRSLLGKNTVVSLIYL